MSHYYNEHDAYRAAVLRERMDDGLLPKRVVDERDIEAIPDEDFLGYTQIHLFAGIGGFPLGLRLAGFSEERRIVTGGFPCQDISNAGKRAGITGSRSRLWREMVRCVRVVRPELVFVENVAALLGRGMGVVLGDLAEIGYDATGDCVSAADVGAPHLRRRIWIVAHDAQQRTRPVSVFEGQSREADADIDGSGETLADAGSSGLESGEVFLSRESATQSCGEDVADSAVTRCDGRTRKQKSLRGRTLLSARSGRCGEVGNADEARLSLSGKEVQSSAGIATVDRASRWKPEPDVGRVAHGIPKRVDRFAALGDAIVPQCAAEAVKRLTR